MTHSDTPSSPPEVALIVGGGPGISASCARLFADNGMRVAVAARTPDKPVLEALERSHGVTLYACDASAPEAVAGLFDGVAGIFGKTIDEADPGMVLDTMRNSAFSAFLVGQQAARLMRENAPDANGVRGTIVFTNASAALKGFPKSGAFAMAIHAKSTTWPIRTASRRPICSCTASIAQPGRSRSCCGPGSKNGDARARGQTPGSDPGRLGPGLTP